MKRDLDRLYELLPAVYRQRDAEEGETLRALLRVIAEQVNVVEDDISQLYENWFIETCQEWVVPYIADLVGFRAVGEAGEAGEVATAQGLLRNSILVPRREVADTLRNRRRKGTGSLLEQLASDVAGWPSRAVEFYRLLAWTQHLNHPHPERGRTADLRESDALEQLDGPFDRAAHTADVRRPNSRRTRGRYNIPSVGLYVWRLGAYSMTRAPAFCTDRQDNHFTFSVLGTDTRLFTRPVAEPDPTHLADAVNVPAPVSRLAFEERTADYYGRGKSLCIWRDGPFTTPVPVDQIVPADLSGWAYTPRGRLVAVDPVLGRIAFSDSTLDDPPEGVWVSYHYGFPAAIGGGEYERRLRPPMKRREGRGEEEPAESLYRVSQQAGQRRRAPGRRRRHPDESYPTISEALEAWGREDPDDAIIQIEDSGSYVEPLSLELRAGQRLEVRAANGTFPHIHLRNWRVNRSDSLTVGGVESRRPPREEASGEEREGEDEGRDEEARRAAGAEYREDESAVQQVAPPPRGQGEPARGEDAGPRKRPSRLVLDGLLVEGRSVRVAGSLGQLVIRHCTLVPGWSLDQHCQPQNETEPSIELIETDVRLTVERSIVGTIFVRQNVVTADPVRIHVSDSVVDSTRPNLEALGGPDHTAAHALLTILRSTVFGTVAVHAVRLAENCIFYAGPAAVQVARTQTGCVRFCYVPPGSRTPSRYNCQPDLAAAGLEGERKAQAEMSVRPQFNSVRYGTPTYCQLAETCPPEITRGADDESEMGVYHDLFQPQREANLRTRLEEFTPAGTDAGIIFAT
ncbi:MAG: hypothetical protein M3416_08515 [Acidobacteriota bacterium]|nr:hypothetical protein [Acidobacteriota bacterium]